MRKTLIIALVCAFAFSLTAMATQSQMVTDNSPDIELVDILSHDCTATAVTADVAQIEATPYLNCEMPVTGLNFGSFVDVERLTLFDNYDDSYFKAFVNRVLLPDNILSEHTANGANDVNRTDLPEDFAPNRCTWQKS